MYFDDIESNDDEEELFLDDNDDWDYLLRD